nr:FliM/FliN family flagellar motor switch protein [Mesorhizobium sp.]
MTSLGIAPGSPAALRNLLVERLVGETAEPDRVTAAARALGERALPPMAKALAELVPSLLQIELESVELGRISQVFLNESNNEPLTVASSANSPDALAMSMDAAAVSLFTALLFGAGSDTPVVALDRALSAMELDISGMVFQCIAQSLNGSGTRALNVRFPLSRPIAGEDRRKQVHRDGPSARLIYRIFNEGGSGRLCVTMPQRIVLSPRGAEDAQQPGSGEWQARFGGEIMRSKVAVEASIPMGTLTLGEVASLFEGQVLEMPVEAPGETRLASKDKTLFICEFGRLGGHYTVRIKQPFDPEADLMKNLLPH